jgi:uncharacterized protein YukE
MADYGKVNLRELEGFQTKLQHLAKTLDEYYNVLSRVLHATKQNWRDQKFDEFDKDFHRYKEEIKKISDEYKTWATRYLQQEIDNVKDFKNISRVQ